jgi:hypothetical protein
MVSGDLQNTEKKPPRKKSKKLSQKEQSDRFIQTAQELEANEDSEAFNRVFDEIVKPSLSARPKDDDGS